MLVERARNWPLIRQVVEPGWILGPGIDQLTEHPWFVRRLARTDREIHVWTVNTDAQLELCQELGVSAIITDRPAYMLDRLDG
jgi:glycerophosphoryl diester phosphodiesterase